ncbi:MAG: hypothetical protein ACE5HB_01770 [Terriglobia bacterium]
MLLGLVLLLATPGLAAQDQTEKKNEASKKKARKVWTNEDLSSLRGRINVVGRRRPPTQPGTGPASLNPADAERAAQLFAQLDKAKEERELLQITLDAFRQDLTSLQEQLARSGDTTDRDMLQLAIDATQADITRTEQELQQLETRIAELEKQTQGLKRPSPPPDKKEPEKPATPDSQRPPS